MKRFLALSSLISLTLGLAACTPGGSNTIKIGYIGPLTGDAASFGADTSHGAQLAVDEINAAGGIDGKLIELIVEDGRCNGADAAGAAQKLINVDKVMAIIGGQCSGETLAAAPIAEAAKVVMLSPLSSSPDVTKAGTYIFRNYPSDALKTTAMARYFKDNKIMKVAMISENTDFCQAFRSSLKEKLPEGAVVFDEVVEPGTKDFRSLMTRLKGMEFDMFFVNGQSDSTDGLMMQQLREAGITKPAITQDTGDSENLAKNMTEAVEGLYIINVPANVTDDTFEKKFTDKYGAPQFGLIFGGFAYDAIGVIAEGVKNGATDGTTLRDWMDKMVGYSGVVGIFSFDDNGDVVGVPYVLKQYQKGEIKTLQDITLD